MTSFSDRRKYKRASNPPCKVSYRDSSKRNKRLEIIDLSAGGISFTSERNFEIGSKVTLSLMIYNALTQFTMNFEGEVIRREEHEGKCVYALHFINPDKHKTVQLDEIINAENNVSGLKAGNSKFNEGMVTNGTHH